MTLRHLSLSAALLLALGASAVAGARPPEDNVAQQRSGIDMRNMNDDQLRRRMQDACIFRLSEREDTTKTNAVGRCGCYTGNVMKAMSKDEADELRATGAFGRTLRPKAEAASRACKI